MNPEDDFGQGEYRTAEEPKAGYMRWRTLDKKEIQYAIVDGIPIFEGDIIPDLQIEESSNNGEPLTELSIVTGHRCSTRNTIHEIGHTVGLWDEQSREDRTDWVTIHYYHISTGKAFNFNQNMSDGDDIRPYKYASTMHFSMCSEHYSTDQIQVFIFINDKEGVR